METFLSLALGIGLAAACGLRVFLPLLVLSAASLAGHVTLSSEFAWIGGGPALLAFATAAAVEILAYYVPWLDNVLDTVAAPAAVVAGTVVTATVITDISPFLKWTLAAIAGGGTAGLVQATTTTVRSVSSVATAGTGNFVVSTGELAGSLFASVLAVFVPLLAVALVAGFLLVRFRRMRAARFSPTS